MDKDKLIGDVISVYMYKRYTSQPESRDVVLINLLTDLRHWAEEVGVDFDYTNTVALNCYEKERLETLKARMMKGTK